MTSSRTSAGEHIVALAVDDRMMYGLLVLVGSIRRTSRQKPRVVVGFFPGELSPQNQDFLRVFLDWIDVDYDLMESQPHELFTERRHLTITTFSKFVMADKILKPHLWLDVDTIVRPGWDEIFTAIHKAGKSSSLVVAHMLASDQTRFSGFNAGVLGWTAKAREPWVSALASLPEKRFSSEQLLFNNLYAGSVSEVSSTFNFLSSWHRDLSQVPEPRIIHYSGPLKPWHLPRRHRVAWDGVNPTWKWWFDAEASLLQELSGSPHLRYTATLRRKALFAGRLHTGKGALAGWVFRFLSLSGPLGDPVVKLLRTRARA
jgi:lipopolysaccharide biosynthesis glycosyltransferase